MNNEIKRNLSYTSPSIVNAIARINVPIGTIKGYNIGMIMFLWIRISLCLRKWLKEIVYCFIRNRLLSYFYSRKKINFILIVFFSIVFNRVLYLEILKLNIRFVF